MWQTAQPKRAKVDSGSFKFNGGTIEIPIESDGNGKRKFTELSFDMFGNLQSMNLKELFNYASKSNESKAKARFVFNTKFGVIHLKTLADHTGIY